MTPDNILLVWHSDMMHECEAEDEQRLLRAVTKFCETGQTVDSVIRLTTIYGGHLSVRASEVMAWELSTPATRAAERTAQKEREKLFDE